MVYSYITHCGHCYDFGAGYKGKIKIVISTFIFLSYPRAIKGPALAGPFGNKYDIYKYW